MGDLTSVASLNLPNPAVALAQADYMRKGKEDFYGRIIKMCWWNKWI